MEAYAAKPARKLLPPITLKGIPVEKEKEPRASRKSGAFIPSVTLYKQGGRTSGDIAIAKGKEGLGEVEEKEGRGIKAGPFSLIAGQYYHRVSVMGKERRDSRVGDRRSPVAMSQFNRKKKV